MERGTHAQRKREREGGRRMQKAAYGWPIVYQEMNLCHVKECQGDSYYIEYSRNCCTRAISPTAVNT
eukprot:1161401-Pelagomonas_calceolata.AAC.30